LMIWSNAPEKLLDQTEMLSERKSQTNLIQ